MKAAVFRQSLDFTSSPNKSRVGLFSVVRLLQNNLRAPSSTKSHMPKKGEGREFRRLPHITTMMHGIDGAALPRLPAEELSCSLG